MGICVTCYTTSCSYNAWLSWNDEFNTMLNFMGCPYYYNIMQVRVSGETLVTKEQKNKNKIQEDIFWPFILIFIIVQSVSKMIMDGQNIVNTEQKSTAKQHVVNSFQLLFQCDFDPAEDNYEDFCNMESTRQALHVGSLEFPNSGDVYFSMINVFMDDGREDVEFCLENYRTLIYNGNFDIICDHTGIMDMVLDLNWSGLENYK